ncbi:MAG: alpha-amylase family protein [Gemmatimonas sp.]
MIMRRPAGVVRPSRPIASLRKRGARAIAVTAIALCASGCGSDSIDLTQPPIVPVGRPVLAPAYRASGHAAAGDVFVHLFEWRWSDIASECTSVLGPSGVKGVQVSPPQEHVVLASAPWWQRYQPVSYSIDRSRSGTRAEFVSMVAQCRVAGVEIYVDAVINHMTAGSGTGSNGTAYTKYSYPGVYSGADFRAPCSISNYQSAENVQDCELLGLADLRTNVTTVQQKIAEYLIDLARIGVAGFRIDAAKHMQPVELDAIVGIVNRTLTAEGKPAPWFFGEVIDYGGEAVRVADYYGVGYSSGGASDITEFKYRGISDKFLRTGSQKLADLSQFSAASWGLMPSDKAVVFVENHDTQRSDGIGYRDGDVYRLANVWMLAQPYGYPSVMSSYAFDRSSQVGRDAGPPSSGAGVTNAVTCASRLETAVIGQWVCEHRDPVIVRMIAFRRSVAGSDINRLWDNGGNAVAFSRGDKGFVAINRESGSVTATIATGLAAGIYCDMLTGGKAGAVCAGTRITVNATGAAVVTLAANSAVVLLGGVRE